MMPIRWKRMRCFAVWMSVLALTFSCSASGEPEAPTTEAQVMSHLNLVLRWARQWDGADVYLARAADDVYLENGRELAQQVVKLEFQSALAQAALIGAASQQPAAAGGSQSSASAQNLMKLQQQVDGQQQQLQASLEAMNRKIAAAAAKDKPALQIQQNTLLGQLQLAQALEENLQKLASFITTSESASGAGTALTGKITALQRTIPGAAVAPVVSGKVEGKAPAAAVVPVPATGAPASVLGNPQNEGLIGQMGQLVHLVSSKRALTHLKADTVQMQAETKQLRAPLLKSLRATLQEGQIKLASATQDIGAGQSSADQESEGTGTAGTSTTVSPTILDSGPPGETPADEQREMTEMVRHFKLLSSATLPLSQELILVDQTQANLTQLTASVQHDYVLILQTILFKVASILIALGLIWLFSELWRRGSFRYIRDVRRRRQFLVLRRVVTGFCMFVVVLLGFVSDFSSLATYAGLITAGIAVALQAVILSVAAYFFLVGRYGVRVGDRVTVVYNAANSVSGDVIDIGLVRFYMMELTGTGVDMQPTGRIVVFPNSVLFQTNPLFKQLPGTEYAWRELALPLDRESDVQLAEKELMAMVTSLYSSYQQLLEREHSTIEAAIGVHIDAPRPYTRIRFAGAGLELMVHYPIPLRQAAELDDKMVVQVMELLAKNPTIRLAAGGSPDLRSPVKM